MGKAKKQKNKNAFGSNERNVSTVSTKKKTLFPVGKKLKKKNISLSGDLNTATLVAKPLTTSSLPSKLKKKKKKRNRLARELVDSGILHLGNNCDSIANDYGETSIFTDTKSFFKTDILVPEECVIQFGQPLCSPKLRTSSNLSAQNKDSQIIEETNSGPDFEPTSGDVLDNDDGLEDVLGEKNNLKFHKLSKNSYLMETKYLKNLTIRGQINVRVLFGSVEILGWCLNDSADKSLPVFSPRGCGLLSLQPLKHSSAKKDKVCGELTSLGLDLHVAKEIVGRLDETNSLIIVEKSDSTLVSYLSQHVPSSSLYLRSFERSKKLLDIESTLKCEFQSNYKKKDCYLKSQDWDDLAETLAKDFVEKGSSRVVVCGGKAVGKSTLLRFLANRTVQANGEVLFLDFDPGQSEFTVPGCVSVLRINEPLLGPSYTHIRTPERSVYLGHVGMEKCPDRYIQSVKYILHYCESDPELSKMVWLINTMGFNRGVGVPLNCSVIALLRPTRVVQIVSLNEGRNFPLPLIPENVLADSGRWCNSSEKPDFLLYQLPSLAEKDQFESARGLQAKIVRTFMLLAYFHHNMKDSPKKSLSDIIPFSVPLGRLTLSVLNDTIRPADVLSVMNAALVALCEVGADAGVMAPDDSGLPRVIAQNAPAAVCNCVGFGVVRGIDLEARTLFLTAPLPLSLVATVDCLETGEITLPPTLLLNAAAAPGKVPYLITGPGQVTSRMVAKRFRM